MKKMKLYMLLLLVPLILMGCIEKGKPASGISVDVSGTGGYTWAQLQSMINVNDTQGDDPVSIIGNMQYIKNLKTSSFITSTDITNINLLTNELYNIYDSINEESTKFVYTTSLNKVLNYDEILIDSYKVLDLENLKRLKGELTTVLSSNTNATLSTIFDKVNLATTNLPVFRKTNPFYAMNADLFYLYHNFLKPNSVLLSSYGIDLTKIDYKNEVTSSLATITSEIDRLDRNTMEFTGKSELRSYLVTLQSMYTKYLNYQASYTQVKDERLDLRTYETTEFSTALSQLTVYDFWINDVYTQLKNKTSSDYNNDTSLINLKNKFKDYIYNNYETYMTSYSSNYLTQEYTVINSKGVVVLEMIAYLQKNQLTLSNTLGIDLLWTK